MKITVCRYVGNGGDYQPNYNRRNWLIFLACAAAFFGDNAYKIWPDSRREASYTFTLIPYEATSDVNLADCARAEGFTTPEQLDAYTRFMKEHITNLDPIPAGTKVLLPDLDGNGHVGRLSLLPDYNDLSIRQLKEDSRSEYRTEMRRQKVMGI